MANQMIALGVRGPQTPDLNAATARMSNVMANTAIAREKQNAVQRENEFRRLAQSGVDVTTPEGFNQLSGFNPEGAAALRKSALETRAADAKYKLDYLGSVREEIGRARNPQDAIAIGDVLKQTFPEFSGNIDQTLQSMPADPAQFNQWRSSVDMSALKSSERVKYDYDEVTTELATGANGQPLVVTRGGREAPTIVQPRSLIPGRQTPVAPRVGEVEVGAPTFTDGGVGGPYTNDTADILDGIVSAQNDRDYQDALALVERANPDIVAALRRAMPRFDPTRIKGIRAEFSRAFGGAGMPDQASLVAGDRGGVGGPYEGYVEAPQPFRLKDPMQAPMPGSAIVPLPRLGAEKRVEAQATKDVELAAEAKKSKADQKRAAANFFKVSGVDLKSGKDPVADLIKKSTSGTVEALGAELVGALPEQIGGGATSGAEAIGELETIGATITNMLLGGKLGTGISNEDRKMIERMVGDIANPYISAGKRLAAWNRVKKIQSSYLGETPAAGERRTPVMSGIPAAAIEHLRKNPSLRGAFDAKYGAGKAAKILGGK